ncbi:Urotensin-2 receptor [Varanus komodoensis]|uniref:urotensin-2 receptor-like n=1 Tax=Varanus komodoensis TaxID=61221 RepID=UPI001CF77F59|nr:urotensin-2 receptor-like [Varanus komodoensis]KAF7249077.1 Urotensin-2 receptor [Varanus komodoensis]
MERNLSAGLSNGSAEAAGAGGKAEVAAWAFGAVLSVMYVAGVTGNVYTLALLWRSGRCARGAPLSGSIASLALADLLYLCSIPFIVGTSVAQDWYFGELGCRVLLSLDLLTMHASIFTLTVMCTERYLAITRPLATRHRARRFRKATAGAIWGLSLLLTLPMMLMVTLSRSGDGKHICAPTWSPDAYRLYLTVLFTTSILAPGLIIGCLYARLATTYLDSQRNPPRKREPKRSPRQKVLILVFTIVLVFWACFLPFWIWQLVSLYHGPLGLPPHTQKCINYLVTCLTYSNSCINPFLYTLLTRNYREYLRNRRSNFYRFTSSFRKRSANLHCSWRRSTSSDTQYESGSEGLSMAVLRDCK